MHAFRWLLWHSNFTKFSFITPTPLWSSWCSHIPPSQPWGGYTLPIPWMPLASCCPCLLHQTRCHTDIKGLQDDLHLGPIGWLVSHCICVLQKHFLMYFMPCLKIIPAVFIYEIFIDMLELILLCDWLVDTTSNGKVIPSWLLPMLVL